MRGTMSESVVKFTLVVCSGLFVVGLGSARGDTITIFTASGTVSGVETLSGSVVIDTQTGTVPCANLFLLGLNFDTVSSGVISSDASGITVLPPGASNTIGVDFIQLVLPTPTLIGYAGGPLCSNTFLCDGGSVRTTFAQPASSNPPSFFPIPFHDVQLTPLASVPEPSSRVLVMIGLVIVGLSRLRASQRLPR